MYTSAFLKLRLPTKQCNRDVILRAVKQGVIVLYSQEYVHAPAKVAGVITMQGSWMGAS